MFTFVCEKCKATSGPTTVALCTDGGAPARHVVSAHIHVAIYFLPLHKPRQRHGECDGHSRDLFEEFIPFAFLRWIR